MGGLVSIGLISLTAIAGGTLFPVVYFLHQRHLSVPTVARKSLPPQVVIRCVKVELLCPDSRIGCYIDPSCYLRKLGEILEPFADHYSIVLEIESVKISFTKDGSVKIQKCGQKTKYQDNPNIYHHVPNLKPGTTIKIVKSWASAVLSEYQNYEMSEDGKLVAAPIPVLQTNKAMLSDQIGSTCYAHAATSAYINTVSRIYQSTVPNFESALAIATYSCHYGKVTKSLALLERAYGQGVRYEVMDRPPTVAEMMSLSIIVSFSTSAAGWQKIASGSLLSKPTGNNSGSHSCLIEGYDLENHWVRVKNSWGLNSNNGRFNLRLDAVDVLHYIKVFWTVDSVVGKQKNFKNYKPTLSSPFIAQTGIFKGLKVRYMDKTTATYETSIYAVKLNSPVSNWTHWGVELNDWLFHNASPTSEYPLILYK